ncbi:NACHT, LRR and PYD domains-containing protein 9 [Pipistrellus kuhlii]|uniref:NACHT, LRR and PYD domains-containing protein 9 n=1 Tax=Pipistrellus kuhlii TaxID=59472 RepID=UPI001E271425|nr:NACHT, LRR and PYD domains-containing protein 9 [Pipistrellus kuhlii]
MAESFFSDVCLLWYLKELKKDEFWKFKELLKQEPVLSDLPPIPWPELKKASRDDLATLLCGHYPGQQAWEIALRLFQQVNRRDLWAKAKDEIRNKINPYKRHMERKFSDLWKHETCLVVPENTYAESTRMEHEQLSAAFAADRAGEHSVTAALLGTDGGGKTTLLRRLMLQWASGRLWQGRFTFVFFISCAELNDLRDTSLAGLLAADWPAASHPVHDVFSRPEKVLFIVDGLEELTLAVDTDEDVCTDLERPRPVHTVLRSLLQRALLPEASLLVSLGPEGSRKLRHLLPHPVWVHLPGFSGHQKWRYFSSFFADGEQAAQAFAVVQDSPAAFALCQYPLACWVMCASLKQQLQRRRPLCVHTQSITSFYASFLLSAFQPQSAGWPRGHARSRLRGLCALAAEGTWAGRFVFRSWHLRRHGVADMHALAWVRMQLLRQNRSRWVFPHPLVQVCCGALWYLLRRPQDPGPPRIGSAAQLVAKAMTEAPFYLAQMALFLFGFTAERMAGLLWEAWGFPLAEGLRGEVAACLRGLSEQAERGELPVRFQELCPGVLEAQDPDFATEVMSLFRHIDVCIYSSDNLLVYAACFPHALNLRVLRLSLGDVLVEDLRGQLDGEGSRSGVLPVPRTGRGERGHRRGAVCVSRSYNQKLSCWRELCYVFSNCPDLQTLHLDDCHLDEAAQAVLWKTLAQPSCRLQRLAQEKLEEVPLGAGPSPLAPHLALCRYNFASDVGKSADFFKALLHNPHLTYLNLHGSDLSAQEVALLSETLRHPMCSIQQLMLGKCDITDEACEDVALLLAGSPRLRLLSLMENPVMNSGALLLSEGLKQPDCALESLLLTYCCITFNACDYLAQALVRSSTLSLLDLSSNFLEDRGVKLLCEALGQPGCRLQQLWLAGCYLTPGCCEDFSGVLISNGNLRTLKLGDKIQDAGVRQLCGALRHPNCKLENLGLELCELTAACCEDLASALTICKSLRGLNLEWNSLDRDGMAALCEALGHQDCALQLLGLDKDASDEETQNLLRAVEEKNLQLTICTKPWDRDELMLKGVFV